MNKHNLSRVAVVFLATWFLSLAVCRSQETDRVRELGELSDLTTQFNEDEGLPRVVLLLAPT